MESLQMLFDNPHVIIKLIVALFMFTCGVAVIMIPFMLSGQNKKLKAILNGMKQIHDEMFTVEDILEQNRKEMNVSKFLDKE